jgi:hypothetical protein
MGSGSASVVSADSIDATGGTITTSGGRKYHTFTTSGFFTYNSNPNNDVIQVLLVGSGGCGGQGNVSGGGGGGGGGVLLVNITSLTPGMYNMIVQAEPTLTNNSGGDSTWSLFGNIALRAKGGGVGGNGVAGQYNGVSGGSGGGAAGNGSRGGITLGTITGTNPVATAVVNLASVGGFNTSVSAGNGGGGAMSAGGVTTTFESGYIGGEGGAAYLYNGVWYGGGGGGGARYDNISRGAYGGSNAGNGGYTNLSGTRVAPTNPVANTGAGGGGGYGDGGAGPWGSESYGSRGAAGVVIISYPLNTTSTATYSPGVSATNMFINGIQPSFSNYPIIDTRVAGSGSSWTVAATFNTLSGAPGISTVTFYYVYK